MKKSLLGLLLATCVVSSAHAQLHRRSHSYAGIKLGGSASSYIGDNAKNQRYVYGFNGGLFANLLLSRPFSLQPEILYSMKGAQDAIGYSDVSTWLSYVDIPVALRASTQGGLFVEAGPQVGFLISAKNDLTGEKASVKSAYKSVDVGFVLGAGYQPMKGGLGISGRYNAGLQSVLKDPTDGSVARDLRNSVFQISLTYSRSTVHKPSKRKEK